MLQIVERFISRVLLSYGLHSLHKVVCQVVVKNLVG